VLKDVPAYSTVVGVPARVVALCRECDGAPGVAMDQSLPLPLDYVI
jgi:serine acetyltransferase